MTGFDTSAEFNPYISHTDFSSTEICNTGKSKIL